MDENQKLREIIKKRFGKLSNQKMKNPEDILTCLLSNSDKEKLQVVKFGKKDCSASETKDFCINEYVILLQSLEKVGSEEHISTRIDTVCVPYKIPELYSLEKEMNRLVLMERKMEILNEYMDKEDTDRIKSDWVAIGGDIREAIRKFRRINARELG